MRQCMDAENLHRRLRKGESGGAHQALILEAVIGLVTAFDIKADVLVSLALIASVCIGENFAAGEVAFIMQLGALLLKFSRG